MPFDGLTFSIALIDCFDLLLEGIAQPDKSEHSSKLQWGTEVNHLPPHPVQLFGGTLDGWETDGIELLKDIDRVFEDDRVGQSHHPGISLLISSRLHTIFDHKEQVWKRRVTRGKFVTRLPRKRRAVSGNPARHCLLINHAQRSLPVSSCCKAQSQSCSRQHMFLPHYHCNRLLRLMAERFFSLLCRSRIS